MKKQGLITVCAWCGRVNVGPYWLVVALPNDAIMTITHGICPECEKTSFPVCEHCENAMDPKDEYCRNCGAVREG